jgi:phosphoglycolate phosphatase
MRLVVFDCDGTLVDSQNAICAAMEHAFNALQLPIPTRSDILNVVGLSLPQAFAALAAGHPVTIHAALAEQYRSDFPAKRQQALMHDALYPGIGDVVTALSRRDNVLLGIATGKSKRGVARLLDREGWRRHFVTVQTADDNPSKPDPSMILRAMAQTGADPSSTLMIGDTSYDMEMACSAGVGAIGVTWGYHTAERLLAAGAHAVVGTSEALLDAIDAHFGATVE